MSFTRRRSVPEQSRRFAFLLGAGRIAFGAVMVVAPRGFLAAARNPSDQVTPSALLSTRMTGARDVVLGANVLRQLDDRDGLRSACLMAGAADVADTLALAASTRWPGFFAAGASGLPVAAGAAVAAFMAARSLD